MSFQKKVDSRYAIVASGMNDTFVDHGNKISPQKPEDLGLPKISVKSLGSTVYSPRFTIAKDGSLHIQFGHYWGGGAYCYDTILGKDKWGSGEGGLNLYGGDKTNESLIDESEMKKLRKWMATNEASLKKALLEKIGN